MSTPTTTLALDVAFRAAIQSITPRHEHERVSTWRYTPGPREQGTARHLLGTDLRSFDLLFDPARESQRWYGNGAAYSTRVRICTSYSGVPTDLIDHMRNDDGVDLLRCLMKLSEPTVPGLSSVSYDGATSINDEQSNVVVEHVFLVNYAQSVA